MRWIGIKYNYLLFHIFHNLFSILTWTLIFLMFKHLPLQVIDEFDKNVHYVEIDIEEDQEIAEAAGIMGTPCVQYFKNKEMLKLVIFDFFSLLFYHASSIVYNIWFDIMVSQYININFFYHWWVWLFYRTVSGVKMKREYREFIETNK